MNRNLLLLTHENVSVNINTKKINVGLGKKYKYESLIDAIRIVVPHQEEQDFFAKTLEETISNNSSAFEGSKYRFGLIDSERNLLKPPSKELPFFVFYDLINVSSV